MELKSVDAALLQKAVLAAAKGLEAKKEWINELNVFPVPDGDTGTNMTMTIMAAAREVAAIENPTMESIAKALSSGSLRGARGNSGVILSQLFRGFTKVIAEYDEINVQIIMERLGGGGHINTAGAQFPYSDMERAIETLKKTIDIMIEEGDI